MPLAAFIRALPGVDLPFPETDVHTHALRSEAGLVVFFTFLRELVGGGDRELCRAGRRVAEQQRAH